LSINIHAQHFESSLNYNSSIFELLKIILAKSQLLIFIFLLFFFIVKVKFVKFFSSNKIMLLFIIYGFLQFFPFFFKNINLANTIYVIQCLNVILLLSIFSAIYKKKIKEVLIISYIVLFLVFIYFLAYYYFNYFSSENIMYGFYNEKINFIFEYNDPPRSSGISRSALFLLIFVEFGNFLLKKKIKYILISILFIPIIFLTQSRINISLFLILFIYLFIFVKKRKVFFLNYIFIPLLFIIVINIFKPSNNVFENSKNDLSSEVSKIFEKNIRQTDKESFSSKRFEGWIYIFELKRKNLISDLDSIVGFGPQGDRLFVKYSISNALLYAFLSCGIIGVLILLLIYLNLIILIYKKIKSNFSLFLENEYVKISFFLILFIVLRSFLENSFSIFGIDFVFLLTAIQTFNNEKKKS
jgi:O-antigen ligase